MKNDIICILNEKLKELSRSEIDKNPDNQKLKSLLNVIILVSLSQTKIWKCNTQVDLKNLNIKHLLFISEDKYLTKKQKEAVEKYLILIKAHQVDEVKNLYKTEKQHELLINKIIALVSKI